MTARDELRSLAGQDMPVSYDEVDAAIDAYAHELAEKIRHHGDWINDDASEGTPVGQVMSCGGCDFVNCDELADLIDPEA